MLAYLDSYKIPAMRQAGLRFAGDHVIALFSRSGFSEALVEVAGRRDDVRLVPLSEFVADVIAPA
jgi:hypothetical protein